MHAARIAFADKGFHGTTTRDIAAAAGMSPAALYVHHATKESLLFEISLKGHQTILRAIGAAVAEHETPTEQLWALVHAFVREHAEHYATARIVNYETAALTQEHRAETGELARQIQQVVRDVLTAGVRAGEFRCSQVELTASSLIGMASDVARWYDETGPWTPTQIADQQAALALRMLAAPDVAAPYS